jgi:hypothetical protein
MFRLIQTVCYFTKKRIKSTKSSLNLPVTGIPENPCLSLISKISLTRASGPTATGSIIKPCSKRLTLRTSFAWLSIVQL